MVKDKFGAAPNPESSVPPPSPVLPSTAPPLSPTKEASSPDHSAVLINAECIELGEVLGEGSQGSVHKGTYLCKQESVRESSPN